MLQRRLEPWAGERNLPTYLHDDHFCVGLRVLPHTERDGVVRELLVQLRDIGEVAGAAGPRRGGRDG